MPRVHVSAAGRAQQRCHAPQPELQPPPRPQHQAQGGGAGQQPQHEATPTHCHAHTGGGAAWAGAGSLQLSRDWGHLTEDCEDGGREEAAQPRPVQEAVSQDQGEVVRGAAGQEEAEAGQDTPSHHHA